MAPDTGEVYIITDAGGDEEWFSPRPAGAAIADAVATETDLEADDLDDIGAYVDPEKLREVLRRQEGSVAFRVENLRVSVDADGSIEVSDHGE